MHGFGVCPTCSMVHDLRTSAVIQQLMKKNTYKQGRLEVDATLCDHLADFHNFTEDEFGFEANTCDNHFLGIAAAQYTHRKYFKSQQNYDRYYDAMVRVQKLGVEVICEKAHELIEAFMVQDLDDQRSFDWWDKTWSLKSGYGRGAICHGMFAGFVTNVARIIRVHDGRDVRDGRA